MSCVTSIMPLLYIIFASYLMLNQRGRFSTGDAGAKRDESPPRTPSCLPSPKMATRAREQKTSETTRPLMTTLRMGALRKKPCKIAKPGEPKRKVCPFLLGKSSEGEVNVLYYRYEGYSSRGLEEGGSSANW